MTALLEYLDYLWKEIGQKSDGGGDLAPWPPGSTAFDFVG